MSKPILITNEEYLLLESPQFIGQTRPDKNGNYQIHWESKGVNYYTINNIN